MNDYANVMGTSITRAGTLAATGPLVHQTQLLIAAAVLVGVGTILVELGFRRGKKALDA